MQVGIKFTITFIWLLGYWVPPQWERGRARLLGVHSEHIRKHCRWKPLLNIIWKLNGGKGADKQGYKTINADVLENTSTAHPVAHARFHIFQGKPYGWHHFRSKGPTRADIAQLPVTHAHAIQQGVYCAISGCACAHPREPRRGHVTLGHFR